MPEYSASPVPPGYIPTTTGTPTGVPVLKAGYIAMRYDTVAHKIWVYDNGWLGVVVA